jgi:hypothetical protein
MLRKVLAVLFALLLIPTFVVAQEGESAQPAEAMEVDTTPVVRDTFVGNSDNLRNWGTIESRGQLQSTLILAPVLRAYALVRRDAVEDSLIVKIDIDLTKLTTGFPQKDSVVFSKTFLNFDTATVAAFKLLSVTQAKENALYNEESVKYTGTGEVTIGGISDTVVVNLVLAYLEENKVTNQRLPGNLLHLLADYNFRLSDFGIKIPKEALLRLDDRLYVHVDMFLSSSAIE